MSKASEYQKEYEKILYRESYEYPENTICNYHSLVEDMIETIRELEEAAYQEYQTKKLKLMTKTFNVGIQLLHPDAKLPIKANPTDSCYDVVAVKREDLVFPIVKENGTYYENKIYGYKYHLGFALDLPPDTELQVRSRSSIYKTGLVLCNGIGTGDEGYTGEYSVVFYHVVPELPPYKVGDRVAQIQCVSRANINFVPIDKLPDKDRGANGFGSSGL